MQPLNHYIAYDWYIVGKIFERYNVSKRLPYWFNREYKTPYTCSTQGCFNNATVEAHVANIHMKRLGECIVPLCPKCARLKYLFNIKLGIPVFKA